MIETQGCDMEPASYVTEVDRSEMPEFRKISEPPAGILSGASLFLDLDGTILELASSPTNVQVPGALVALLRQISEHLDGRLAVISGRSVDDVAALFPGLSLNISGSHGHELRWADGRRNTPDRSPGLDHALTDFRAFAARHPGLLVEDKPFGVALHYRAAPLLAADSHALAHRLAEETGLPLQTGKMVVELKASVTNKGDALAAFMAELPMREGRPVFIGDDDNDEPAFEMAMDLGGHGILVGAPRPTHARWRLDSVGATRAWIGSALGDAA
jgi:trehalose 6-phosphate phosphatase